MSVPQRLRLYTAIALLLVAVAVTLYGCITLNTLDMLLGIGTGFFSSGTIYLSARNSFRIYRDE